LTRHELRRVDGAGRVLGFGMTDSTVNPEGLRVAIGLPSAVILVVGGVVGVGRQSGGGRA